MTNADDDPRGHEIRVTRLYADEKGVSHFGEERLTTAPADFAPPAPPIDVTAPRAARRTLFLNMPAGWYGEPHPAPAEQLMIVMVGRVEVGTGDDETRVFGVGDAVLVQDTTGGGHSTRILEQDVVIAVAQY